MDGDKGKKISPQKLQGELPGHVYLVVLREISARVMSFPVTRNSMKGSKRLTFTELS